MRTIVPAALVTGLFILGSLARASIVVSEVSPTYTQDFNTLDFLDPSSVLPASWSISESGSGADATYEPNDGSSDVGNTYSYGYPFNVTGKEDRALGTLRKGNFVATFGVEFSNGGSSAIEAFEIAYYGEEWRLGTTDRQDRLDFQYSLDATSLTTGTWIDVDGLDFATPNITGVTIKDGNDEAGGNRVKIEATIGSLALGPSASFWIRWTDLEAIGSDDGLAVDDFAIRAIYSSIPEPGAVLLGALACVLVALVAAVRKLRAWLG
jgi:hypothetical protein